MQHKSIESDPNKFNPLKYKLLQFGDKWYENGSEDWKYLKHVVNILPRKFVNDYCLFGILVNWDIYRKSGVTIQKMIDNIEFVFNIHLSRKYFDVKDSLCFKILPDDSIVFIPDIDAMCIIDYDIRHHCQKVHLWQLINLNLFNLFKFCFFL